MPLESPNRRFHELVDQDWNYGLTPSLFQEMLLAGKAIGMSSEEIEDWHIARFAELNRILEKSMYRHAHSDKAAT